MSIETERVKRIEKRWNAERKISGADVKFLIERAKKADVMLAADSLRRRNPVNDLFGWS